MSVSIKIVGKENNTDEYLAAKHLKEVLERGIDTKAIGEIFIHPSVTLLGQAVKDIDIIVCGSLINYIPSLRILDGEGSLSSQRVEIRDFCTVVELKNHSISGIEREGSDFYVKYGESRKNVTAQSNKQKEACKSFILSLENGITPYITNVIWFKGITKEELECISPSNIRNNIITNDLDAKDFFQRLVWQVSVRPNKQGQSLFSCSLGNGIDRMFSYFDSVKAEMGELTRKRIEQISEKTIGDLLLPNNNKLVLYRGKAGTGKTVGLIQTAIKLVDEKSARVLILTYNRALVSDIRRLFAFAELPDMFQEKCVHINTIHAFFYHIVKNGLYDGMLDSKVFIDNYSSYLKELDDFIDSDTDAKDVLIENMNNDSELKWDYCLVDEGQDWTPIEQKLLLNLFDKKHIIVADGGLQFVRKENVCDWTLVDERESIKLKYCLRQKDNLITFINHYISSFGITSQKIMSNNKLSGGRIVICKYNDDFFKLAKEELSLIKKQGNAAYDMLVFTPGKYVDKENECFVHEKKFKLNDIPIWDGTNAFNRMDYSLSANEVRVFNYKSGRGLEAWTVVCIELDTYIENIIKDFDVTDKANTLALESEQDRRIKHIVNWLMIPLTRAIDTLIITLRDYDSAISKQILRIAREHEDYVSIK